ncbi:FAD-dependent oxidoreductase [Aquabacterium sp.]|uniref:FAD-dependent oxidoreductase n=1 Tax=Aquabacterium sp. TaxID=1872578 RepID=UPI002B80868D|nr:FAD-dependent oxidoreductase [Aquabacterium sp.]HSW08778.1 FAD-dependent oxidoreductase [Aquabacterium sp.]
MPTDATNAARPSRRRALGTLAAAAGLPVLGQAAAVPRQAGVAQRKVAVIGAGMAGVACAWLLDGDCEVNLFEARASIGGNVQSVPLTVGGQSLIVDVGAQFFHPGPYPTYVQLLTQLGLYPPSTGGSHAFIASITVDDASEAQPRFVSPILPGRAWPLLAPWNRSGIQAFSTMFRAAQQREEKDASWKLTVGAWLPTLQLSPAQIDGILLPWIASLYSGDIEQARTLSARAALVFAAKALPPNPVDPLLYYVLERGMADALQRMVDQFSSVTLHTAAPVTAVSRLPQGGFALQAGGGPMQVFDDLVFASSGPPTSALLQGLPGTAAQRAALQGMAFFDATLAIHEDAAYVAQQPSWRSFLNCRVQGPFCEASMDLAQVLAPPPAGSLPPLWKSWVSHRQALPAAPLHVSSFKHMLPTPDTLAAQQLMQSLQGQGGLWFAGGYLRPFDAQETALLSAMGVAEVLNPGGARLASLAAQGRR